MWQCVPAQSQASELLDGIVSDPQLLRANLRDMARANRWLGANRAVLQRIAAWLATLPSNCTPRILDVATGGGDLAMTVYRWGVRQGQLLAVLASDLRGDVLQVARQELREAPVHLLRHSALQMPFADGGVDIVTCTQALHHFTRDAAAQLLRECARVARLGVIINDLRRSYPAYWGARLLALGTASPLSRHDGPLSVLRAYTPDELKAVAQVAGVPAHVQSRRNFRVEVVVDQRTPDQAEAGGLKDEKVK